jgi:hypothetical protein
MSEVNEKASKEAKTFGSAVVSVFQNHAPGNNNYELVVQEGFGLQHYWFDFGSNVWNKGQSFGDNVDGPPAMFQNHAPGNNNYELSVRETWNWRHYWFGYGNQWAWNAGQQFG